MQCRGLWLKCIIIVINIYTRTKRKFVEELRLRKIYLSHTANFLNTSWILTCPYRKCNPVLDISLFAYSRNFYTEMRLLSTRKWEAATYGWHIQSASLSTYKICKSIGINILTESKWISRKLLWASKSLLMAHLEYNFSDPHICSCTNLPLVIMAKNNTSNHIVTPRGQTTTFYYISLSLVAE